VQVFTLSNLPAGTETFVSHTNNALQSSAITPASDSSVQVGLAPLSISSLQLAASMPVLALDPVGLAATRMGSSVWLDIAPGNDTGAVLFEIERSADGVAFDSIGVVPGPAAGGGAGLSGKYSFFDNRPLPSVDYYRLKIVDRSGGYVYSRIVAVSTGVVTGMSVFPNPANDVVYVQLPAQQGTVVLELHESSGKLVRSMRIQPSAGGVLTSLDLSRLARGVYYLSAGGKNVQLVKQ
jgi:hypothetical protein